MTFKKKLIKPSSFKTPSKRSQGAELKSVLLQCSHEASRGFGAQEFKAICEEFLSQYEADVSTPKKKAVKKAVAPKKNVDDLLA